VALFPKKKPFMAFKQQGGAGVHRNHRTGSLGQRGSISLPGARHPDLSGAEGSSGIYPRVILSRRIHVNALIQDDNE
jgi:hypothetical protein